MRDGSGGGGGGGGDIKTLSVDNLITVLQVMLQSFFNADAVEELVPKRCHHPHLTSQRQPEELTCLITTKHQQKHDPDIKKYKKNTTITNISVFFSLTDLHTHRASS